MGGRGDGACDDHVMAVNLEMPCIMGLLPFLPRISNFLMSSCILSSLFVAFNTLTLGWSSGRDGTGSPGHGSRGQRFWPSLVRSRVSAESFNMHVYHGVVSTEQLHLGKLISA